LNAATRKLSKDTGINAIPLPIYFRLTSIDVTDDNQTDVDLFLSHGFGFLILSFASCYDDEVFLSAQRMEIVLQLRGRWILPSVGFVVAIHLASRVTERRK
jgi:hypothetical protein